MEENKQSAGVGLGANGGNAKNLSSSSKKKKKVGDQYKSGGDEGEVLFKLPAGFTYKLPGKRQRLVIGWLVVGLNALLVLAVVLYFYNPAFKDFVYTVGRT